MKSIVLQKPGEFLQQTANSPEQACEGEALVSVRKIGICGTDLHAYRGRQPFFSYPRVLGHELGVDVIEVGNNDHGIAVGDRCAVEPYLNCGTCIACRAGKTNCCTSLKVLGVHIDGGMCETIRVPTEKLHKSNSLELEQLALVETLGIGCHAVDRTQPGKGERVLVIGAGPIGLSVSQFAIVAGADVYVMDMSEHRLAFCRDNFSVKGAFQPGDSPAESILQNCGGELPTAVFDATGNVASMQSAFGYVASGGRLTFVGLVQAEVSFHDPEFHRKELTLLASRNSRPEDFRRIIELMEAGTIDTTPWITHRVEFDGMIGQFENWLKPETGVIKAMVEL